MLKQQSNPRSTLPGANEDKELWTNMDRPLTPHTCEKCEPVDPVKGKQANEKLKKITSDTVARRREAIRKRFESNTQTPKVVAWKTVSKDSLLSEYTKYCHGMHTFEPQAAHKRYEEMRKAHSEVMDNTELEWDYTYGSLSPVDEAGYGFGCGIANYTKVIFFAAKLGAFETIEELQNFYMKLEREENPCLDIGPDRPKLSYSDTLKYFVTQMCAGLKFSKTCYEAAKFSLNAMKRNSKQMNAFAFRYLGIVFLMNSGVDNTTDWSKLTTATAFAHQEWTTSSLIKRAKELQDKDESAKLKDIQKELVRRCSPEYADAWLRLVNSPTKNQHHAWQNRIRTDHWLRSYIKETRQVQSNHAMLCQLLHVYIRYREKINLIPYNVYIYSKFTIPTEAEVKIIHDLFPFEVTLNALATSDRNTQGTMGKGDKIKNDSAGSSKDTSDGPSDGEDDHYALFSDKTLDQVEEVVDSFATPGRTYAYSDQAIMVQPDAFLVPNEATFADFPALAATAVKELQDTTADLRPILNEIKEHKTTEMLNGAVEKINKLCDTIQGPINSLDKLVQGLDNPKIKKFMNTQVESITKCMSKNEDVAVILKPLTAMIRAYIPEVILEWPGFKDALENFPWFTMLLSYMAYQKTTNKLARSVIIGNFLVQLGGVKVITTVLKNISDWILTDTKSTQGTSGEDSIFSYITDPISHAWEYLKSNGLQVGMIGAALAGVCAVLGLAWSKHDKRDETTAARLATTLKEAGFISNGIRNLGHLGKSITEVAATFFSWLYTKITGNEWVKPEDGLVRKILALRTILDFYNSDAGKTQMYNHAEHRECAKGLIHEGDVCMGQIYALSDKRMTTHLSNIIGHDLSTLKKSYFTAVELAANRPTERITPFVIAFVGESGVGKTEMTKALGRKINKEIFNAEDPENLANWNPNADFQDGYNGQKVAIVEEVNAIQTPEAVAPLLQLFSSAPMVVDKARLEDKGHAVSAEVFLTTSNTIKTVAEKLTAPWAIDRRRNILIEPRIKASFKSGKNANIQKIKEQRGEDSKNFVHCDFYILHHDGKDVRGDNHPIFHVTYPESHPNKGKKIFKGSSNPLSWPDVVELSMSLLQHHRAVESEITQTHPFKRSIDNLKVIADMIQMALARPEKLWGINTSIKEVRRRAMAMMVAQYDKIQTQIEQLNAYKLTQNVPTMQPLPKLEDFLGEENTEGTAAQTIPFMNAKKEIHLAHPKYISSEGVQAQVNDILPRSVVSEQFEGRGPEYDLRVPAIMIKDVRNVKTVAVSMDVDFARMVGISAFGTIVWRGQDDYSLEEVKHQDWFKRSLQYWNNLTMEQKLTFSDYVEDKIEPIVSSRTFFVKYWYSARNLYREFSLKYLSPIAAFFSLSAETKAFMRVLFGVMLTAISLTAIAVIVELYAPEPTYRGTMNPYSGTTASTKAAQIAVTGIPQKVARSAIGTSTGIFMEAPTNNVEAIISKVSRNLRLCYVGNDAFQGIFLKSNIMLIPAHCAISVKEAGSIEIFDAKSGETIMYEIEPRDLVSLGKTKDQALLHVRDHTMMPDITKYIPETCDVFAVKQAPISVAAYTTSANRKQVILRDTRYTGDINPETNFKVNNTTAMGDALSYEARAPLGSSGGMVFTLANKEQNHPLFAIQSARSNGLKNKSFVSILNKQELVDLAKEMLEVEYERDQEIADTNVIGTNVTLPPVFTDGVVSLEYVGEIEDPKYIASPWNSLGYIKSPIYDIVNRFNSEKRQPSIMNLSDSRWRKFEGVLVDPMQHSILKTARDKVIHWSHEEIDIAIDAVSDYMKQVLQVTKRPLKVLTIEEAIHSDENRMNPHTSAGMPWKARINMKGKEGLFRFSSDPDSPGTIEYINQAFYDECVYTRAAYQKGLVPPSHTYIFAKAELRPIEKIWKTRSIDVVSATTGVVFRQYHQDLTNRMILLGDGSHPWTFGINPNSYHWQTMATYLKATAPDHMEPKCFDLDISNWDGHMTQQIAVAVARICSNCYGSDELVRKAMAMEMIGSYSAFERHVFKKTRGMCSGWPGTTLYNTIGHILIGYMIYRRIMLAGNQTDKLTFQDWLFYTCPRYYGDDNITSVRPEIQGFYNGVTVSREYTRAGLPATPGTKTNQFTEFLPLSEVTFLKRSFVWDSNYGIWLAPLDKGVIYDMVRWIRVNNKNLVLAQFVSNFYDARQEMVSHGLAEYTVFQTLVLQAAQNAGLHIYIPTIAYSDIMRERLSNYYGA